MEQVKYAVVLVTVPGRDEADRITLALLNERKAACVNIVPNISSYFWWQDQIDHANELLLVIKTRLPAVPGVIDVVKRYHSYTVPEIIALPIVTGNEEYLKWIEDETSE